MEAVRRGMVYCSSTVKGRVSRGCFDTSVMSGQKWLGEEGEGEGEEGGGGGRGKGGEGRGG